MTDKLMPCPFCGGEGEISYYARHDEPEPAGYFVECCSCSASGEGFDIEGEMPDRAEYTKARAIAAWNTRPPAEPSEADVERACIAYNQVLLNQPEEQRNQPLAMRAALAVMGPSDRDAIRAEMLAEVVETVRGMPLHAIASGYIDIADALQAKFGRP